MITQLHQKNNTNSIYNIDISIKRSIINEIVQLDNKNQAVSLTNVSFNANNGMLKNFSTKEKGILTAGENINFIDLYARYHHISRKEAIKELSNRYLGNYEYPEVIKKKEILGLTKEFCTLAYNSDEDSTFQVAVRYFKSVSNFQERIKKVLNLVHLSLELSELHNYKYKEKRGHFDNSGNFKSVDKNKLKELYLNLSIEDKKAFDYLQLNKIGTCDLLIFSNNLVGEKVSYRKYSFNPLSFIKNGKETKGLTKQSVKGFKNLVYGLEKINNDTKELVICESEEKAEAFNTYNLDKNIIAVGLVSCTSYSSLGGVLDYIKERELKLNILFDRELDKEGKEKETNALISFIEYLNKNSIHNIDILLLPLLESKNDIDSYLLSLNNDIERNSYISNLLKYSIKAYDFIISNKERELKSYRKKHLYFDTPTYTPTPTITRQEAYEILPQEIEKAKHEGGQVILNSCTAGLGKSTATLKMLENEDKLSCSFALATKELRNEMYNTTEGSIIEIEGVGDQLIRKLKGLQVNETLIKKVSQMVELGFTKTAKKELELANIKHIDDILTVDKGIMTQSKMLEEIEQGRFKTILNVIDEDITSKLISNFTVDKTFILDSLEVVENKDLKDLAIHLYGLLSQNKNVSGSNFMFELNQIFIKENLRDLNEVLESVKNIALDNIIKDELKISFNGKFNLYRIKSFYKILCVLYKKEVQARLHLKDGIFTIFHKRELKLNEDQKLFILDATASKNYLQHFGINVDTEIDIKIKQNITVSQCFDKSFKQASQIKNGEFDKTTLNLIADFCSKAHDSAWILPKKSHDLLLTKYSNFLSENRLKIGYYRKDNRATNKYKDCKSIIISPINVDDNIFLQEATAINNDIKDFSKSVKKIGTGYIKDDQELYIEKEFYNDSILNDLYEKYNHEMIQAVARVIRDDNEKNVLLLGDMILKDHNIITDKIIDISKYHERSQEKIRRQSVVSKFVLDTYNKYSFLNLKLLLVESMFNQNVKSCLKIPQSIATRELPRLLLLNKQDLDIIYEQLGQLPCSNSLKQFEAFYKTFSKEVNKAIKDLGFKVKNIGLENAGYTKFWYNDVQNDVDKIIEFTSKKEDLKIDNIDLLNHEILPILEVKEQDNDFVLSMKKGIYNELLEAVQSNDCVISVDGTIELSSFNHLEGIDVYIDFELFQKSKSSSILKSAVNIVLMNTDISLREAIRFIQLCLDNVSFEDNKNYKISI